MLLFIKVREKEVVMILLIVQQTEKVNKIREVVLRGKVLLQKIGKKVIGINQEMLVLEKWKEN